MEVGQFVTANMSALEGREGFEKVAATLRSMAEDVETHYANLEELEQRLTALEDKIAAIVRSAAAQSLLSEVSRSPLSVTDS